MTYDLEMKQQRSYLASTKEEKTSIKTAEGGGQCLLNRETKPRINTWLLTWKLKLSLDKQ